MSGGALLCEARKDLCDQEEDTCYDYANLSSPHIYLCQSYSNECKSKDAPSLLHVVSGSAEVIAFSIDLFLFGDASSKIYVDTFGNS